MQNAGWHFPPENVSSFYWNLKCVCDSAQFKTYSLQGVTLDGLSDAPDFSCYLYAIGALTSYILVLSLALDVYVQ